LADFDNSLNLRPEIDKLLMIWLAQKPVNEGKSDASFCRQVAALIPAMLYNFYLVKNHKIIDNSATTEPREKN
jgi:hypothetical protein